MPMMAMDAGGDDGSNSSSSSDDDGKSIYSSYSKRNKSHLDATFVTKPQLHAQQGQERRTR